MRIVYIQTQRFDNINIYGNVKRCLTVVHSKTIVEQRKKKTKKRDDAKNYNEKRINFQY